MAGIVADGVSMRIDILTLFPQMFDGPFSESIIKRAQQRGLVNIVLHNIRDYARDQHSTVDDYSYGGGPGMILKPEPIFEAVEVIKREVTLADLPLILLSPQGRLFSQKVAQELAHHRHFVLLCGHYEGVDERVREHLVDDEISIGDYVLSGGELAAMVVVDAVVRLLPGALGSEMSLNEESHAKGLLEYPQYTHPRVYRGWSVPEVLLSGDHGKVAQWRRRQAILRTLGRRPDLLKETVLSEEEKALMEKEGGSNRGY